MRELVAASRALGIARIDLGRGDDEYKLRAKTGEVMVSQGIVTRSTTRGALRRARKTHWSPQLRFERVIEPLFGSFAAFRMMLVIEKTQSD